MTSNSALRVAALASVSGTLDWSRDGNDWPNRSASRFVEAGGLTWHVQVVGDITSARPVLLLVHGTGASTHSWRDVAPLLAEHFTLVMPDLPGHGFTSSPGASRMNLPDMARAIAALMDDLQLKPDLVVGHSAGVALLVRMCLDQRITPRLLISLNGALLPFGGLAGVVFSPLAKFLAANPLAARFVAKRGESSQRVADVLEGTGSKLDDRGLELYRRLFASPGHVASALQMMAGWDLVPLQRELPRLTVPLLLVVASDDRAVAPETGITVRDRVPGARISYLRNVGHLAHEERPAEIAALIVREAIAAQIVGPKPTPD
jgi:magnesium chelatase accessory protein